MSTLHEECGIYGIFAPSTTDVASSVYYGLFALQHRGQESCGIVVNDDGVFTHHRDNGIVDDVFTKPVMESLGQGNMALGHVRYATANDRARVNAQPVVINHIKGAMALAHNGNVINAYELREELELSGSIFHSASDAEVISYVITRERITSASIEEAVRRAVGKVKGAFSFVVMSPQKMIAVRDPHGFRPLCYGQMADGSYVVASESCALEATGASLIRDLKPGEVLVFDKQGIRSYEDHCDKVPQASCVFEYIYFARPDSVIDGCLVHDARLKAGEFLAKTHPAEADLVVGVPDSGLDAALGFSRASGIPYGVGFIKNRYIGRTFIAPGQKHRENRVRIKLNPVSGVVKGKRIVLIDDSIVRGTTCAHIVHMLREAGATEVHMRISSPPFINPCYYGTDISSKEALIANNHTIEEIREIIGVDSLGYLTQEQAKLLATGEGCKGFCTACFDGVYPGGCPAFEQKSRYERKISEKEETK